MLLKTDSHPIKHCFTESKLTRRSIALINNPKFHSLSREKKFSKIIKFESSSHHVFPAREIESALTRSFTLFGKLSCSLREQSVRNRFLVIPKGRRLLPSSPLSTPRSKSLSAIRTYSAHVNRLSDRRGGGGIIFYRVFNNSWYARVSNPRCWIIGAEGNRTGTMARRLIICRMATGWIQGSPNDPWLKRIKGLRRSARLLWGNLIKQKFRRREFLSPSNEIDFRGG